MPSKTMPTISPAAGVSAGDIAGADEVEGRDEIQGGLGVDPAPGQKVRLVLAGAVIEAAEGGGPRDGGFGFVAI